MVFKNSLADLYLREKSEGLSDMMSLVYKQMTYILSLSTQHIVLSAVATRWRHTPMTSQFLEFDDLNTWISQILWLQLILHWRLFNGLITSPSRSSFGTSLVMCLFHSDFEINHSTLNIGCATGVFLLYRLNFIIHCRSRAIHIDDTRLLSWRARLHHRVRYHAWRYIPQRIEVENRLGFEM